MPEVAGLAETKNSAKIEASQDIKSDIKIANTAKTTTAPTNEGNLSKNINIDNGYVDLRNRPEFNKIEGFGDVKPTLKEVGTIRPNNNGTGAPNSMYEYQTTSGKPLSQHFYNSQGNVEFEINFKPHDMFYPHGHINTIPGDIMSGHLRENHVPFMLISKKYW